ncbi:MAG: sugar ABC transporter substrate-binding protein [Firmicutes bacterium]|nr:sugar ABC transporter substrate-binding protein [Bacillota bacterium]
MKKLLFVLLVLSLGVLAACNREPRPGAASISLEDSGLDENGRFIDQRSIVVATWDRRNDGGSDPTDNAFTDFIKEGMLRYHNVAVTFKAIYRWNEVEELTIMLAEGVAPDVSYTFNWPTIEEFGRQGAVWNLQPFLDGSEELFPNLWNRLGRSHLYWNQNRETGEIWSVLGTQAFNQRFITFIREDWLEILGLPLPSTLQEFEDALVAFSENAELLLGPDAPHIVPLRMTEDIGWVAGPLIESFIPDAITDRDLYIYDTGGARNFFRPGVKEAIRVLNRWFHMGLIDPDFALYGMGNDTPDNQVRAGFVGALMHSWDMPYRDGSEGWTGRMHELRGTQANFIAVNAFQNDAGYYRKILGAGTDRNLFVPATSTEPIAALLYLDFLSRPDVNKFLQTGFEGINHEVMPDGALRNIPAEPGSRYVMNSGMNYDLTMPINGLDLGDFSLTQRSRALGYAGVEARLIEEAVRVQTTDVRIFGNVGADSVTAEAGMGDTIRDRGNAAWARAIVAPVADFDAVYDREMGELLRSFAQAAIDERRQLWYDVHGDATMLP